MNLLFCRLSILTIFLSFFSFNLLAAELGIKHEYGLSILGSYDYEEPKLMHLRSGMKAEDDRLKNFGILKINNQNLFTTLDNKVINNDVIKKDIVISWKFISI